MAPTEAEQLHAGSETRFRGGHVPRRPSLDHDREPVAAPVRLVGPSRRARILLAAFGTASVVALFVVGGSVDGGIGYWPRDTQMMLRWNAFTVAIPEISTGNAHTKKWGFLVVLGDPKVFAAFVTAIALVSVRRADWRLSALCLLGPAFVMFVDECVAKPTFFHLFGGHYGFPSGHVTAVAVVCCLAVIAASRMHRLVFVAVSILAATALAAAMVGVIVLHMHPLKDSVGGALFALGTMALMSALALRRRPVNYTVA